MDPRSAPPAETPTAIGDYRVDGVLGQGGMGVVYRATHRESGQPVALKTVLLPDEELLRRIRREIHALARIHHPGVVRIVDEGLDGGLPWYAMERIEGRTLDRLDSPDREEVLTLVRRLCTPLAFLHGEGIVHRDLKPGNVIVRPDGTPVLVDFGLIAEFDAAVGRETATEDHLAAGTPTYMAPEQISGALVDARTDLYALGCVLYELLVGKPPFTSASPVGLAVAHMSEAPRPPSARTEGVPPALDALILRLLAKRPEERIGYAVDVAAALAELGARNGAGAPAPPPRTYLSRPGFAGREGALDHLDRGLRGLADGAGGVVLVGGESGVGKTRLVLEAARRAADQEVLVLVGEALDGAVRPLEPLRKPLQAIADRCRELGPDETRRLVGARADVLAPIEPSLADLPGNPPTEEPPDLSPDAARERLFTSLIETLGALAELRPLLLIVDDLQWAGDLTLGFLASLVRGQRLAGRRVLVVGTYRTEEVGEGLDDLLAEPAVDRLALDRLDDAGVGSIVADMLAIGAPPQRLVGFVARQSEGNPFFVGEYLRTAVHEGLITRDSMGRWQVVRSEDGGDDEFAALPVPGSLRDLVSRRLATLSRGARELLQVAAVVGREGQLDRIQAAAEMDDRALDDAFVELIRRHVAEESSPGTLRFLHDKLREAVYGALAEGERRALHQRVARALEANPAEGAEYVYGLAHHHARGEVERNAPRVFETCAAAGTLAVANNAPAEACTFFDQAARAAALADITPDAALEADWGEACAQLHRVVEAVEHLERALAGTTDGVLRSRLRARLAIVRLATWDSVSAWRECEHALAELGHPFPRSRLRQLARTVWDWGRGLVSGWIPGLFGGARGAGRERSRALAIAYQTGMVVSYFEMDAINFFQMAIRALLPANRLGPSPEMVEAYSPYAVAMGAMGLDGVGDRYAARAVEVAAGIGDVRLEAGARYWQAVTTSFAGKAAAAVPAMREVLARQGRWLDTADFINGCADLTWNLAIRGYAREAWEVQELLQTKIAETRGRADAMESHPSLSQQLVVLPLLGRADEARDYYALAQRIANERPGDRFRLSFLSCNSLMFHLEQGELGEGVDEAIREYERVSPAPARTLYHLRWFHVFRAYVWAARCEAAAEGERGDALTGLRSALVDLRRAANVDVLRSHLRAAEGAFERLRVRPGRARRALDRADRLAARVDSPWVHFEVARQRALLCRDRGDAEGAEDLARRAHTLAAEHGWTPRRDRIAAEFDLG